MTLISCHAVRQRKVCCCRDRVADFALKILENNDTVLEEISAETYHILFSSNTVHHILVC